MRPRVLKKVCVCSFSLESARNVSLYPGSISSLRGHMAYVQVHFVRRLCTYVFSHFDFHRACRALSLVVLLILVLVLVFSVLPVFIARVYCIVSVFFPSALLLDLCFLALPIRRQLVSFIPYLFLTSTFLLHLSSHLAFVLSSLTFLRASFLPSFPFWTLQVSS